MVEDTDFNNRNAGTPAPETVKVFKNIQTGENVRTRGMDIKTGYKILFSGTRLRAPRDRFAGNAWSCESFRLSQAARGIALERR